MSDPENINDLDDETVAHLDGLLEAMLVCSEERAFHEDRLDKNPGSSHTYCRNTAERIRGQLFREAIRVALSPEYSRSYHRDKARSEDD